MSSLATETWRFGREDRVAWLVVLLPFLVALPQLVGLLKADPLLYTAAIALEGGARIQAGTPYIDPNNGYGTQALGKLATWIWLHGSVPWWNHFTGIGMPLAAEYQPAAFFPITFLQLLPYGMAWQQLALQVIAGLGTYGLLRQLGTRPWAATVGGLLFAFNGTLAWFAHAPATAVPFLPWMLWGIERIAVGARAAHGRQWGMLAGAMAFSLLSGFPETAYLNGLMALAWTVVRGFGLPRTSWRIYSIGIVAGGLAGVAIAAPQVYAFLEFLTQADIGGHGERFAHEASSMSAFVPSLAAPYFFGPIFAFPTVHETGLTHFWHGIGGYVTLALVFVALAGLATRRDAISWLLATWCVLTLARTFGFPGSSHLWNLIPGISLAAFYRYACPSWELALVLLAARGLDSWIAADGVERKVRLAALAALAVLGIGLALSIVPHYGARILAAKKVLDWAIASSLVAIAVTAAAAVLMRGRGGALRALGAVLVLEAIVMYAAPTLSNPRSARVDMAAVQFLRDNLGLHRFFTLGPLQPNYGAYFRLASINYNVLPNTRKWFAWVKAHLDNQADSVAFNGGRPGPGSSEDELRRNLVAYEEVGVRFVVTWPKQDPFRGAMPKVYSGAAMDIFMLPNAKPYFDSVGKHCRLDASERDVLTADCKAPDRVFRRELFYPGWTATSAGRELPIREHLDLYQSVELPAGRHEVRFSYAPPHIGWAWLASVLGLASVASLWLRRARPSAGSGRSAT